MNNNVTIHIHNMNNNVNNVNIRLVQVHWTMLYTMIRI